MAHKQWIDYKKTLGKQLTDNVRANEVLSPIYFLIVLFFLNYQHHLPVIGKSFFDGALFYAFISSLVYIYSSNYYQPDLDIHHNRPGMGHFPFGRWVGYFRFGRFLKWAFYPVNRAWYYLWHPYGNLLTHRGVAHWPIIGVYLRTLYLWAFILFVKFFLERWNIQLAAINSIEVWLGAFFPGSSKFGTIFWFTYCFPVFMSDIIHWAVDYWDSYRKGISFCPPKIPRGIIAQLIQVFSDFKNKK